MEKDISEILNTALELQPEIAKNYFIEMQKKSSHSYEVFLELIRLEIIESKKKYAPFTIDDDIELINRYPNLSGVKFENLAKFDSKFSHLSSLEIVLEDLLKRTSKINYEVTGSKILSDFGQVEQEPIFQNKFNAMPIEEVRIIFSPLVTTKNKANQYWMTRKDFDIFLKRSFGMEDLAKPKINFGRTEKGCIIKLFHIFYTKSIAKREITSILIKPYKELLAEAFETEVFFNLHDQNFSSRAQCDWMIELK